VVKSFKSSKLQIDGCCGPQVQISEQTDTPYLRSKWELVVYDYTDMLWKETHDLLAIFDLKYEFGGRDS